MMRRRTGLSDYIKVTVVIENDEKSNNRIDKKDGNHAARPVIVTHASSATLMSTLLKNGLISGSFCGGRGDCGRCRIQFLQGVTMPTALERSVLEPEELRQGYRLACLARPKGDCVIRLALENEVRVPIVSEMIDLSADNDLISQQRKSTENRKSHDIKYDIPFYGMKDGISQGRQSDSRERKQYVAAVDLGTTTIAMQLFDLLTGEVVDTYCEMNPQRSYGADVLSRIHASCEGHRDALKQMVWDVLGRGVSRFAGTLNPQGMINPVVDNETTRDIQKISCMCIAGNTTMEHLLLGYDVSSLGVSPFTPVETGLQEIRHPAWEFPIYIAPGISTFVGGDIVAGLYALGMLGTEQGGSGAENLRETKETTHRVELLIDLGTNGEMAITDGSRMLVTATAAGPAFEGGAGAQMIGTDMIAVTADLLEKGVLDETGLLAGPYFNTGVIVNGPQGNFTIENKDIRNLQLAKAAVRAGVEVLWKALGTPAVDRVYLAGGFGYYLDVEAAFRIGLLPGSLRGKVQAVGNTSLAGACKMARELCNGAFHKKSLEGALRAAESMNLAKQEDFEKLYIRHMNLSPS